MRRPRPVAAIPAVAVAVAAGLAVWQVPRLLADDGSERRTAEQFAAAWTTGQWDGLTWHRGSGDDPAGRLAALTAGLTPAPDDRPAEVTVGAVTRDGDRATAALQVRWELGASWSYATSLPLRRTGEQWAVALEPTLVHPSLQPGQVLRSRLVQPARAPVTDRSGAPIVTERPVVHVGLQPSRTSDLAATVAEVARTTDVDADDLLRRASAARPDDFVEVVTLRREAYDAVRSTLRPVPGVVLREGVRQLAPTAAFARALLGRVGPATAELVEESGGRVRADQTVGLSGLQRLLDARLAGTPGLVVEAVPDAGAGSGTGQDGSGPDGAQAGGARPDSAEVLHEAPAVPGAPVQLTLDPDVQLAADAALAALPAGARSALVVVQPSTGDLLAVANAGPDGPGVDRALSGRYPPGSTFKIASTLALLRQGLAPDDVVPCPATMSVQGKRFRNAEDEVLGDVPFREAFAHSCNTSFVSSAGRVTSAQLQTAARDLGYRELDLGVEGLDVFGGEVPLTDDAVEHAAQMIGQGRVLASPLAVAVSAAAVADGRLRLPRLLADVPAVEPGPVLPQAADLQALTRQVVTDGTGSALREVPGDPVRGKTGTAEYGTAVPPPTHAWFTGSSGDLAFAVVVEDGGFGGQVAAPVAADLLRRLRS